MLDAVIEEAGDLQREISTADWLKVNQLFLEQLAHVARRLDAIQEGERTALDKSMLMICSSMMTGMHENDRLPVAVPGRAGGKMQTGRVLDYSKAENRRMCRLHLSMMDKMGRREKHSATRRNHLRTCERTAVFSDAVSCSTLIPRRPVPPSSLGAAVAGVLPIGGGFVEAVRRITARGSRPPCVEDRAKVPFGDGRPARMEAHACPGPATGTWRRTIPESRIRATPAAVSCR